MTIKTPSLFEPGTIWAYPTDTSFGLGVRCDDPSTLVKLKNLKKRAPEKFFSLMVRDWDMLDHYAEVPNEIPRDIFITTPTTLILKPKKKLPESPFWPADKVAFRICLNPDITQYITVPITATSANLSGQNPIYSIMELDQVFGNQIKIYREINKLNVTTPSQIWDYTTPKPTRRR